ncbi:DUF3085 domain-containing protein [Pseudomonas aeruginosa]
MLRFREATLLPVLKEAQANQCQVILVKDHGVYFMSQVGDNDESGSRKLIAYADGCNPAVDDFEVWYERAIQELGGDDFGEHFDIADKIFQRVLVGGCDLNIKATPTHFELTLESSEQ